MSADESNAEVPHREHLPHRSSSSARPKGILKNAPPLPASQGPAAQQHSLQWDEQNIALTEIQKDSLMKITEPKTPYVRYNAETDEIEGEIPQLDLGGSGNAASPVAGNSRGTTPDPSDRGSRRTSISSTGRASTPGRSSSSNASSRSTSFSLPSDSRREIRAEPGERGDEIEFEEMDEETAAKHREFMLARRSHYANEAEAMKKGATQVADILAKDDEEEEAETEDSIMDEDTSDSLNDVDAVSKPNGMATD